MLKQYTLDEAYEILGRAEFSDHADLEFTLESRVRQIEERARQACTKIHFEQIMDEAAVVTDAFIAVRQELFAAEAKQLPSSVFRDRQRRNRTKLRLELLPGFEWYAVEQLARFEAQFQTDDEEGSDAEHETPES